MADLASLATMTLALFFHFRWTCLNTHDYRSTPAIVSTAARSVIVAVMICVAVVLSQNDHGTSGAIVWTFSIGAAFAPAVTPALLDKPNTVDFLLGSAFWSAFKSAVVWLVSLPIVMLPFSAVSDQPAYWSMVAMSIVLGFFKFGFVMSMIVDPHKGALGYPSSLGPAQVIRMAGMGAIGLAVWVVICDRFIDVISETNISNLYRHGVLALGFWVSDISSDW